MSSLAYWVSPVACLHIDAFALTREGAFALTLSPASVPSLLSSNFFLIAHISHCPNPPLISSFPLGFLSLSCYLIKAEILQLFRICYQMCSAHTSNPHIFVKFQGVPRPPESPQDPSVQVADGWGKHSQQQTHC